MNPENEAKRAFEQYRLRRFGDYLPKVMPILLLIWTIALCVVPDPKPLAAPEWAVNGIRSSMKLSEHASRAVATTVLRSLGIALLGVFVTLSLITLPVHIATPIALLAAPALAVFCQRMNYGYFPVWMQLQISLPSAIFGALAGLALRRSWVAGAVMVIMMSGGYLWGTSIDIDEDLANDAKLTGEYLLSQADEIPEGEAGFAKIMELAFAYADDNSHQDDAIYPNKVAILALGVIVGEEKVASIARQQVEIERKKELQAVRSRLKLGGRNDLARHFTVSAALTVLTDDKRSLFIGIGKELMDSTEGGSGFSFVDIVADKAGIQFAVTATRNQASAKAIQQRIIQGFESSDFFPSIDGLPEGIKGADFESQYGGLGGKETRRLLKEIDDRVAKCPGFAPVP